MFMGWIADISKMAFGFVIPLICFAFIIFFGLRGYKVRRQHDLEIFYFQMVSNPEDIVKINLYNFFRFSGNSYI